MRWHHVFSGRSVTRAAALALPVAFLTLLAVPPSGAEEADARAVRIGCSCKGVTGDRVLDRLTGEALEKYLKLETGLTTSITPRKDWRELAAELDAGKQHLGVFQGFEFAWVQEQYPDLKPLLIAVRSTRYPVVCVVTTKESRARGIGCLRDRRVFLAARGRGHAGVYASEALKSRATSPDDYFRRVATAQNFEEALDDVVNGDIDAAILDESSLEAYGRRQPERRAGLKVIERSRPFPPLVLAGKAGVLDEATRTRLCSGLVNAGRTDRGQMMLLLLRLSAFEEVPADFAQVLSRTREHYPSAVAQSR